MPIAYQIHFMGFERRLQKQNWNREIMKWLWNCQARSSDYPFGQQSHAKAWPKLDEHTHPLPSRCGWIYFYMLTSLLAAESLAELRMTQTSPSWRLTRASPPATVRSLYDHIS
jgi:hypothetical protein